MVLLTRSAVNLRVPFLTHPTRCSAPPNRGDAGPDKSGLLVLASNVGVVVVSTGEEIGPGKLGEFVHADSRNEVNLVTPRYFAEIVRVECGEGGHEDRNLRGAGRVK